MILAVVLIVAFTAAPAAALTQDTIQDDPIDDTLDGLDGDTSDADGSSTENVQVRIVATNSPVQSGDTLEVRADIKSDTGGSAVLLIDGEQVDQRSFAPGTDGEFNFSWETGRLGDSGEHTATIESETDNDSETVQVEMGPTFPRAICTDVPGTVDEEFPYDQFPNPLGFIPEEAPLPVPDVLTPEAVVGIVVGALPTQCAIQDPNDPSVDPTDPPSNPGGNVNMYRLEQTGNGGAIWFTYRVGLAEDGPGVSGSVPVTASQSGGINADPSVTVNDGEKDYVVDPRVEADQETAYYEAGFGTPFGGGAVYADCQAGECQPGTKGLPNFQQPPAIPAPIWSGEER